MTTTIKEDIQYNIRHARKAIDSKREEIRKLEMNIKYYEGEYDALNSLLNNIENGEAV